MKDSLAAIVVRGQHALESVGLSRDDARRDAAVLARWALGWDRAAWLTRLQEIAPAEWPARFDGLIARRATHEPVAYITGEREFYGRTFVVTPDVLIPRPETELIVEEALACIRESRVPQASSPSLRATSRASAWQAKPQALSIVDVGTGSGCLAVTLALECPIAWVIATDTSPAALDVARKNARRLEVHDRVEFRLGSLLADAAKVDLIVSNPPYVTDTERASLPEDVARFEPGRALFAGADGLDVIRALIPAAAGALSPGGSLIMEIGAGQANAVSRIIDETPHLALLRIRPDLQDIPRVVVAVRE